jgi:nucleotide-binding universal stress UspA family protein
MTFKRILVATDFSENARHALDRVRSLLDTQGGRVVLMTALGAPDPHTMVGGAIKPHVNLAEAREQAEAQLRAEAKRAAIGQALESVIVRDRRAEDEILAAARELEADLIVVGSHGYRGFKRWVIGSVSEQITRQSEIPVLLVPMPPDHGAEG